MKRIKLDDLASKYRLTEYKDLYSKVMELIDSGKVKPVKASGINGKSPALYKEYWIIEEKQDMSKYVEELDYDIVPAISTDYYKTHLEQYMEDRQWVLLLNKYLKNNKENFMTLMSENERSYDIWHREKFLKQEQGKRVLKRCEIEPEQLHYYRTTEPIAYYTATRQTPQALLILENKDTFYSMRKFLLAGNDTICDEKIGTLLYGAGKGIIAAFSDFETSGEPYMLAQGNRIYYFGDLDYEGIRIYESFAAAYGGEYDIRLFTEAYCRMLTKAYIAAGTKNVVNGLPLTKEGQNRNIGTYFLSAFSQKQQDEIKEILENDRYIPQEILNWNNF